MTDYVPAGNHTVGTCSICGGPVCVPSIGHGIIPPIPTCSQCGAVVAAYGPVIPMRPAQDIRAPSGTTADWNPLPSYTISRGNTQ